MASTELINNFCITWRDVVNTVAFAKDAPNFLNEHNVRPWLTAPALEAYWSECGHDWESFTDYLTEAECDELTGSLIGQPARFAELCQEGLLRSAAHELVRAADARRDELATECDEARSHGFSLFTRERVA